MKKSYIFVLLIILLGACNPSNNPAQPVDVTQTASITSIYTLVPTETLQPTTTKVPATRTPTPIVPMTTYFDKETGMQISYPAHWVEKSHRFFSGNDGYLLIKNADQYHSRNLWNVAIDFTNTYYPFFAVICAGFGSMGCAVYETDDFDDGRVVDIFPYASTVEADRYVFIETTFRYYHRIVESIVLNEMAFMPTPTNAPIQVPDPQLINVDGVSLTETNFERVTTDLREIIGNYCGATAEPNAKTKFEVTSDNFGRMQVRKGGETIFRYTSRDFAQEAPWTFCQWDDSWMMETHDIVIVDGQILNHETGRDEIFGWHLLKGKPVYFARSGTKYSVFVDGKMLPIKYDDISHYLCCGFHPYNPQTDGNTTKFSAQRNGVGYIVELSIE